MSLTFVLLILLALLPFSRCQPQYVQDIVVTGVTGCTDQPPVTLNCSLPATLRIHTAGLPPGWPPSDTDGSQPFILLRAGNVRAFGGEVSLDPSDPTNATLLATVMPNSWLPQLVQGVLNLTINDGFSINSSASVAAFSFAWSGPPVLTSISGCVGGGSATLSCVPDETVLTISGSGLSWLGLNVPPRVNLGSSSSPRLPEQPTVFNDSYATIPFYSVYYALLQPMHYNGSLLPISFTLSNVAAAASTTNALSVSFAPQPPPSIALVVISACNDTESMQFLYVGCVPNLSVLQILGDYLYNATATIGGQVCVPVDSGDTNAARQMYCTLPAISGHNASKPYDLVMTNEVGSTTLPGIVQLFDGPSLYGVVPCIQRGTFFTALVATWRQAVCAAGSQVVFRGAGLVVDAAVQVSITARNQPTPLTCQSASVVDSSTLTCTLPALASDSAWYQNGLYVQAQFTASGQATNALAVGPLFLLPTNPIITALSSSGCTVLSPLQLSCLPGAVLSMAGANLNVSDPILRAAPDAASIYAPAGLFLPSRGWLAMQSGSLVYQLPDTGDFAFSSGEVQLDTPYDVVLYMYAPNALLISNAFLLTFSTATVPSSTGSSKPSTPSSSSSSMSAGAIAGAVIGTLAAVGVLLAVVAYCLRRRRFRSAESPASHYEQQSDTLA